MRRSLASRAIALLSAATGGRSTRRWVFSTTLSVSYSVSVPKSYSIVELQVAARLDLSTRRKRKRGSRCPVSPFRALLDELAGSTGSGGLKLFHRLTRLRPRSSVQPTRTRGPWFWYGTRRDLRFSRTAYGPCRCRR